MIAEKSIGWRLLSVLLRTLLWVLAAVLAALALGAFASLNPAAPTWMRTLGALEGVLQARLLGGPGLGGPGLAGLGQVGPGQAGWSAHRRAVARAAGSAARKTAMAESSTSVRPRG